MEMKRVLIIDDDPRIGRIIKRVATKLQIDASVIDDSQLFESKYLTYQPDVIFMDLLMPGLDGVELLRTLADNNSTASVVLMSGVEKSVIGTASKMGKSMGLNMSDTLNKPICIDSVETLLIKHFHLEKNQSRGQTTTAITDADLHSALDREELVVHYQPQFRMDTGKIRGAAALVRWNHPEHGMLDSERFLPIAEENQELIELLTYKILEIAARDDKRRRENNIELMLSVSLSTKLLRDLDLPDKILRILALYQVDPSRLILEVSEKGAMENPSQTMDILTRLRLKNIRLSLDDVGRGFSSLLQIYGMPFNEIRAGKALFMGTANHKEAAETSRVRIGLGHSLGLDVVAEGVADEHTYDWLQSMGCDVCQGDFLGAPADATTFINSIDKHNSGFQPISR